MNFKKMILPLAVLALAGCVNMQEKAMTDANNAYFNYVENNLKNIKPKVFPGTALISIRWVKKYDSSAIELISKQMDKSFKSREETVLSTGYDWLERVTLSTNYYALALYDKLKKLAPESEILLEPLVATEKNGKVEFYSESKKPYLPALFTYFFFSEGLPPTTKNVIGRGNAIGFKQILTTSGLASPDTCGLVMASIAMRKVVLDSVMLNCKEFSSRTVLNDSRDFIDTSHNTTSELLDSIDIHKPYPEQNTMLPFVPNVFTSSTFGVNGSDTYFQIRGNPDYKIRDDKNGESTLDYFVKPILEASNNYPLDLAARPAMSEYVTMYDLDLSKKILAGNLIGKDVDKLELIKKFIEIEKKQEAKINDSLVYSLLDGKFGQTFRALRLATIKTYDERNAQQAELRHQKNKEGMNNLFSMLLGASQSNFFYKNPTGYLNFATEQFEKNINFENQYAEQSANINNNIANSFQNSFGNKKDQEFVEIEVDGKVNKIAIEGRDQLRNEFVKIYNKHFPKNS